MKICKIFEKKYKNVPLETSTINDFVYVADTPNGFNLAHNYIG